MMQDGWLHIKRHALCRRDHRPGSTCLGAPSRVADGFTKQYDQYRLVYAERYDDILAAEQRERNIKHWPRR